MKNFSYRNPGRRAAAGAAAVFAAAGILLGGLFRSPAELMDKPFNADIPAITEALPDLSGGGSDDGDGAPVPEEKRRGVSSRLRRAVLSLPAPLRALVGVPLWVLGWGLSLLLSSLWSGLLSPALSGVLHYLLLALFLLAVLAVSLKAAHPALPLRKVFSRRSFLTLGVGMLLVGALDVLLSLLLPDEPWLARLLGLAFTFAVLLTAAWPFLVRHAEESPPVSAPSPTEEDTRALVESLAASVSR